MKAVAWLDLAEHARRSAVEDLAQRNLDAALELFDAVQRQTERLVWHPHLGKPGRRANTRELLIEGTSVIVTYRITDGNIQILHLRHLAQQITPSRRYWKGPEF